MQQSKLLRLALRQTYKLLLHPAHGQNQPVKRLYVYNFGELVVAAEVAQVLTVDLVIQAVAVAVVVVIQHKLF
jgi:hypothetical protein